MIAQIKLGKGQFLRLLSFFNEKYLQKSARLKFKTLI